jgi:hypothetical protein
VPLPIMMFLALICLATLWAEEQPILSRECAQSSLAA